MNAIKVELLKEKTLYNSDLIVGEQFVLLPMGVPVSQDLIAMLRAWGIEEVFCGGDIRSAEEPVQEAAASKPQVQAEDAGSGMLDSIRSYLDIAQKVLAEDNENRTVFAIRELYNEYIKYIHYVYTRYATHGDINKNDLSAALGDLCGFLQANGHYVVTAGLSAERGRKDFLIHHALRSTAIAIMVGIQLKLAGDKLVDLAVACILHEIGMIKLPPQLYLNDKQLSPKEFTQMSTHTVMGFEMLKSLNFPLEIQMAALEHHEKENGTGYPRRLTGANITMFSKIIAVACAYEAITAPRDHKEERTSFEAMQEFLNNKNKQYDDKVVKALLCCLSVYPVGTFVFLKNGKIACVHSVDKTKPMKPFVRILKKGDDGPGEIVQVDDDKIKIARVMNKKESADALKIMGLA